MIEQSVGDVMKHPVQTITPETTGGTVARLFADHNIGSVVVVSAGAGNPIGIVTQSDLLKQVAAKADLNTVRADLFMSTSLVTITSTEDIYTAAALMKHRSLRRLLVIDDDTLVGILTTTDLTDYSHSLRNTISRGRNELANY